MKHFLSLIYSRMLPNTCSMVTDLIFWKSIISYGPATEFAPSVPSTKCRYANTDEIIKYTLDVLQTPFNKI